MHPPPFSLTHLLSDWPDCCLELRCRCSPRVVLLPVRLMLEQGHRPFEQVVAALRCSACQGKPGPAYLVAGHHRGVRPGPSPDWSVQLVGEA